ncbi:MAG TPA: hypothetical protein VG345_13265, partial [Bryobacteraceae bacterium]|nr:hypothetical protein [Bryobacteraceae bacterium]
LRFICEAALNGEASKLNEYLIAHQVFGRGDNYSPGEDSVVRRQAYSLRQKLQEYFETEGREDRVHIELPTGRYVPLFVQLPEAPEAPSPSETPPEPLLPVHARLHVAPALAGIICAAVCAGLLIGWAAARLSKTRAPIDSSVADLWGSWLTDKQGAVICLSNPSIAVVKRLEAPLAPSVLPHPIEAEARDGSRLEQYFNLPPGGHVYLYPGIAHAKMGEAIGGIELAEFFTHAGIPARPTQSRLLNWQFFRTENLILLGHDEANPWLDPILARLPLRLAATTAEAPRRIVSAQPRPGARTEYAPVYSGSKPQRVEDYALISMLAGADGRHRLLLVSGIDAEATQIAIEYLIDPVNARGLESALKRAAPRHTGDWHFQAILKTELEDNVPLRVSLIAAYVL